MFKRFLRSRRGQDPGKQSAPQQQATPQEEQEQQEQPARSIPVSELLTVQRDYWTFDAAEKAALLARFPDGLSWPETLRLHHLACLELLDTPAGRARIADQDDGTTADPERAEAETRLCRDLAARLTAADSPYAARDAVLWQGDVVPPGPRPPDAHGRLSNASLSHLGCLEVVRINERGEPDGIAFVPFSEIVSLGFLTPPQLFRPALLSTRGEGEEPERQLVAAPLLYATSWHDGAADHYRDASITRFLFVLSAGDGFRGIGIGHQDLELKDGRGGVSLLGIGSVAAFSMTEPAAPEGPGESAP